MTPTFKVSSGYDSDTSLTIRKRQSLSPLSLAEQKLAYKNVQKGGDVPLNGLRKPAPERPKDSPRKYVESEVTIHYRSPVRTEAKEPLSEEELARRSAENMRRIYLEDRRRKYLKMLQDIESRRHTDNFIPSQKSPIPYDRYDDFVDGLDEKGKRKTEPGLIARALYNFVGQTSRELTFRRGDVIYVRCKINKDWYEGEYNGRIGLFPSNYVEIIPYDASKSTPKKSSEGQAYAKFNFIAQTNCELSFMKGQHLILIRRVDENWYEGRIGNRTGIFPVSYVEVVQEPGNKLEIPNQSQAKVKSTVNGASRSSRSNESFMDNTFSSNTNSNYAAAITDGLSAMHLGNSFPSEGCKAAITKDMSKALHIDTQVDPRPYRALYNYKPQNEDELELREGDIIYVMQKCDDGWYIGSNQNTGYFGTFPGNYVRLA